MAFTVTRYHTVFGNKRAVLLNITADGAEDTIATGLNVIEAATVGLPQSMATGFPHVIKNVGSTSTAANGYLGCSGFSAGAQIDVVVYGR